MKNKGAMWVTQDVQGVPFVGSFQLWNECHARQRLSMPHARHPIWAHPHPLHAEITNIAARGTHIKTMPGPKGTDNRGRQCIGRGKKTRVIGPTTESFRK